MKKAVRDGIALDERWHIRKDGTIFWAIGATICVRNDEHEIRGFGKIFRNRTLQRRTEEATRSANAELGSFAYTAAHDLKEPVRTMQGYLGLFERRYKNGPSAEKEEAFATLKSAVIRLDTLIDDILSLATEGNGAHRLTLVDTNVVFDSATGNLKITLTENQATVTRGSLPIIVADASQIERLLQNLIANAIKFRSSLPPLVSVSANAVDDTWVFSVKDNGIGIAKENLEKFFSPFNASTRETSTREVDLAYRFARRSSKITAVKFGRNPNYMRVPRSTSRSRNVVNFASFSSASTGRAICEG